MKPRRDGLAAAAAMLVAMVGSVVLSALPSAAATTPSRAMWVWVWQDADSVVQLAQARGVQQLFVGVPPDVTSSSQLTRLRDVVTRARAAGLRVDALGGDPGWVDDPTWAVDHWVRPTLATGLFTGLHVDVEPWTTPAWTSSQSTTVTKYLMMLDRLVAAGGGMPVEADIPFWFDEVKAGKKSTLDRETMRRVSAVTIMAYRNTAAGVDGTIAISQAELASGAALGKPVRIGQETNYLGPDPTDVKQTFYGYTVTQMHAELARVDAAAAASPSYAGTAVHDYTGYAALAP
ncbi:hypothetical protein [Terrabacter sp. MAHUQ-38]|uniref:hypothetical protein n=1 Tax=unclassified Terrabacter TaxID=2630222 RepID=UPI00165EA704|nr:hypothetical protein [Terrabacter sp. MAHUQ-38]MBC9821740.1 hypothetical protein [Terrabacter sp. MAHUQ-38]